MKIKTLTRNNAIVKYFNRLSIENIEDYKSFLNKLN
jgi:hypothetical protein